MSRSALTYVILLLALCAAAYWHGTQSREVVESVETIVRIDTVYIDNPAPPTSVEPSEPKVVYLTEYKTKRDTITVRDSVLVYVPISDYLFEGENYKIGARGYDVSLTSVETYNRSELTTITKQPWGLYGSFALNSIEGALYPSVGVLVTTRGRLAIGADVGLYDNKIMWTGRVSWRLRQK